MVLDRKISYLLIAIVSAFVLIKVLFIHPTFSDETFYFNVGKHVLQGLKPYQDFFFAHPPLQPYFLALTFKIFGVSFWTAKIVSLLSAALCVLLTYLISKELSSPDNEKSKVLPSSLLSAIIFLISPAFIAFSTMGYGMWETLFLVLLSIYILVRGNTTKRGRKERELFAAIVFASAVFFRYMALLYFPFLILLLKVRKIKFKKFAILTPILITILFATFLLVFGQNYIKQTVFYHIFSKISLEAPWQQKMQYWNMGFFSIFLALLSIPVAYAEKDKILFILALIPLAADLIVLMGLQMIFYHYFIISLPFYSIAAGWALVVSKYRIVKIIIPIVLVLSMVSNIQTIDYYLNPTYASRFYEIVDLVETESLENETIFGEPILTNYISFMTDRKIAGNYLDSYMRHLVFEGSSEAVENIRVDNPRFLIEMENYYMSDQNFISLFDDYNLTKRVPGVPNYLIYKR